MHCEDESLFSEAISAASKADITIMVVGNDQSVESEGHDRTDINLPGKQNDLIKAVAAKAKKTILVVMTGGPVDLTEAKMNDKVEAILWTGYPGQAGGTAIAQILFGDVNPSGRLPFTMYPAKYTQVSMFDMSMRPDGPYPGRTYRYYNSYLGAPI